MLLTLCSFGALLSRPYPGTTFWAWMARFVYPNSGRCSVCRLRIWPLVGLVVPLANTSTVPQKYLSRVHCRDLNDRLSYIFWCHLFTLNVIFKSSVTPYISQVVVSYQPATSWSASRVPTFPSVPLVLF